MDKDFSFFLELSIEEISNDFDRILKIYGRFTQLVEKSCDEIESEPRSFEKEEKKSSLTFSMGVKWRIDLDRLASLSSLFIYERRLVE